jgi:hypothetical protein
MAVRLINLHQHPLRIDLRGGEFLLLAPGQRSAAMREELLYDNCHLPAWQRAGWVARVPAKMREVLADAAPPVAAAPAGEAPANAATGAGEPASAEASEPPAEASETQAGEPLPAPTAKAKKP